MGRKYASLHILTDRKYDLDALRETYRGTASPLMNVDDMEEVFSDSLEGPKRSLVEMLFAMCADFVTVKRNPRGYSIFDENLGAESIGDVALRLSKVIPERVLYASVFDDDVFVFGLCRAGNALARHASGEVEAYGICDAPIHWERSALEALLGRDVSDDEEAALGQEGEAFERWLSGLLEIPFDEHGSTYEESM